MEDDFDDDGGLGMPDDDLTGGDDLADLGGEGEDIELDLEGGDAAFEGRPLDGTADYRLISERVRGVVATGSFDLIESMAAQIARECLTYERVVRASVVVLKPNAAQRLGIDGVAAAVTLPES